MEPALNQNQDPTTADREDYAAFLAEHGITEDYVRSIVDDRGDHADPPPEFGKVIVSVSELGGCGMFATVALYSGEHIGPARMTDCRTVLGRMVNHAKDPNCMFLTTPGGGLEMFARRTVDSGEELTLVDHRQAARAKPRAGAQPCAAAATLEGAAR